MRTNIEALLDTINNYDEAYREYAHASRLYFKTNGHGVNIDRAKTDEEKKIARLYHAEAAALDSVWAVLEVLDCSTEERARAYKAARALRRWYTMTEWRRLPSSELVAALERYIVRG